MRLNKAKALRCGRCDYQWHICIDHTYIHGGRAKPEEDWTYTDWPDVDGTARASRKVSASPHSSRRAQTPKSRRKKKSKESSLTPALDPPWSSKTTGQVPVAPSQSTARPTDSNLENKYNRLLAALEKQENSEEMQQLVEEGSVKTASSRQMHTAVKKLDQARDKYHVALKARQNLHESWTKYLDESIKRWTTFAEDFGKKDRELETKVQQTKEKLQEARQCLDETKEAVVQQGQRSHQGGRAHGSRDGRRAIQGGDVRAHSGRHQCDGAESGSCPCTATRRHQRAHCQESKNRKHRSWGWRTWIWALWAGCQNAAAFCSGGQIDKSEVCQAPIWTHSIVSKDIFVSEWKASIKAIDLAFELGCSLHDNDWTIFKPINHSRRRRQLRFATTVDLYVGPEDTVEFGKWPHALEVPYHRASIFHHDWEVDYTSFMAHHDAGLPPVQERVPEPQIIDQGAIAVQEGEEMVHVNVEVTEDEALSEDSWSADIQTRSSWRTTLIFALRRQATTLRLDWRNYDLVHDSIAHELHLFPADIYHVHRVRHPPDDLFQAYVEPVVVQRATDIAAGSMERIVLVDVEFHSSNIASVPEVVRQARVFVTGTTRFQLLHWLGLQPFCQHLQNRCLVWKNNELIAQGHQQLHLVHGDFLRIAVPPPGDRFDHISTRCIATAFYRGLLPQDVLDRHTMYLLGWYDYVIDPPWLPREFRMQAGEEQSFLQLDTHRTPALQDYPNCLRGDFKSTLGQDLLTCPFDRLDEELPDYASLNRADLELLQEFPADPQEGLLAQPATIQELYQLWTHQLAQQPTDETLSLVVHTWFLDFERLTTCTQPREVELSWDFTRWAQQIFEVWDDSIDAAWPINLYLVRPQPPATSRRSRGALHLIVVQRSLHDQVANLFTIVDPRLPEGVQDIATFAPIRLSKDDVIVAINYIDSCYPERSHLQCMTWHGDFELRGRVALRNWHGLSIVLIYQELPGPSTAVPAQVWEQSEDEEVGLLQKSVNRKNKFHH